MKKILSCFALLLWLIPFQFALAAGSGGGGSPAPAPAPAPAPTPTPTPPPPSPAPVPPPRSSDERGSPMAAAATGTPSTSLRCFQNTLKNRVRCRLQLTEAQLAQEQALLYFPEECRVLEDSKQLSCIDRYKSLLPCWQKPVGPARSRCAAQKLKLGDSAFVALKQCMIKTGDRRICQSSLIDPVSSLIKFRFYDLSERAEDQLKDKHASLDAATNLVTSMESLKQKFNATKNYDERRKLILQARQEWKKFTKQSKQPKELKNDYLDQALNELVLVK